MNRKTFIKYQQQALTSDHTGVLKLDDDRILLTADGIAAIAMPQEDCKLDVSKLTRLNSSVVKDVNEASELELTRDCKYSGSKSIIRRLKLDSDKSVYVNDKYIKFFGEGVNYKGNKSKVFVFENDKLIGLIMAIYPKEDI